MKIVQASVKDKKKLDKVAYASKNYWNYPESYIKAWATILEVKEKLLEQGRVYKIINPNFEIFGFYTLEGDPPHLNLDGFWILPKVMGKGLGKKLFSHMIQTALHLKAKSVQWESDPNAEDFYHKQGAKTVSSKEYMLEGKKRILPIMKIEL